MTLNLIKLCVGADSVEDLEQWIEFTQGERRKAGLPAEQIHTTRQTPKRVDDILPDGSLYWVIKGVIQARQKLIDIRSFTDGQGIPRCDLVMEPKLILTEPMRRGPFQGWRYYEPKDAPRDLVRNAATAALPPEFVRELAGLGLL